MWKRRFVFGGVGLLLVGCGGAATEGVVDTAPEVTTGPGTTAESPESTLPGDVTVEVTAEDYVFQNLPPTLDPGATLTFTNGSEVEMHEMVLFRIADEETRTLQELLELSEEESEAVTEFMGILAAPPGEIGVDPMAGDESIKVNEPGRYAVVCFIPEGADPEAVAEAMAAVEEEEAPDLDGGQPHAFLGMVDEFYVEG